MNRYIFIISIIISSILAFTGCVAAEKNAGFASLHQATQDRLQVNLAEAGRTGQQEYLNPESDQLLTPTEVVQTALHNNPSVRIALEELNIVQADMLEALLLDNPSLGGSVRWPETGGGYLLDFDIGQNIQKLVLRASNKKLTALQLEEAKLRALEEIIHISTEAEIAFFEAVGAQHLMKMHRMIVEATAASYEYALRLLEAGNLNDLELAREEGMFEDARVQLAESELMAAGARQNLLKVLGLWAARKSQLTIPDELPRLPENEMALADLEAYAVEQNVHIAMLRKSVEVMAQALGISQDWRWLGTVEFGALAERELDGTWLIGPSLSVELPLFNRSQAELTRQEALLRQREEELIMAAIDLRAEVRVLRHKLYVHRKKANHMLTVIIPNKERIVSLLQRQYNFMLVGVFEVLEAKQDEYRAYQDYIETLHDYWITRAELRNAVGGRLPE